MRSNPGMGERRGWAEALVAGGGAVLVFSFFLPLLPTWFGGEDSISSAGLAYEQLGEVIGGGMAPSNRLLALLGFIYISAPHVLGAVLVVDAAVSRLFPGHLERTVRVSLRCILYTWLAGSFLLPVLVRGRDGDSVRTFCIVFAGLLLVGSIVLGRWWPPRSHAAFMRRGRLIGAILAGVWFVWMLTTGDDAEALSLGISLAGTAFIAAGSVTGLIERGQPADLPPIDCKDEG